MLFAFLGLVIWVCRLILAVPFPEDFIFGVSTAAYQNEGAWNTSGKGPSIWDTLTHERPELILDRSNGDVADNSYNKWEEDIELLNDLGVQFYRFSIAWTRIFPDGEPINPNQEGINFYNNFLDQLTSNGILPMVTIFHWDIPESLQKMGGFMNPRIIDYYTAYAKVLFDHFGDRVKYWITINEPKQYCQEGHGEASYAPAINISGVADYLCGHNIIRAHAAVYHMYDDYYRSLYDGEVGISLSGHWFEAYTRDDEDAAERMRQFYVGWWANPIFSSEGDYPKVMKEFISKRSSQQGYPWSRLPEFTEDEINYIRGTADFFGFNHYTTFMAQNAESDDLTVSYANDHQVIFASDPTWARGASAWLSVVPWGFRKYLKWIKDTYSSPIIYVTENGFSDHGGLHDPERVQYYKQYMEALLEAIYIDEVEVKGYAPWTLMDNFEWFDGYVNRFGLYGVDFSDPNLPRKPKDSAKYYKEVIKSRRLV
ncbi:myrosinase 1-like [Agrilus planipennis]|uniref:beta-glucosidase n=1 Tax=Agrilus planipennis TaxID=224129 RepID=A0A1W4WG49_AGRPL|nr:myrosinase 1-like [Agrilus planipennis]